LVESDVVDVSAGGGEGLSASRLCQHHHNDHIGAGTTFQLGEQAGRAESNGSLQMVSCPRHCQGCGTWRCGVVVSGVGLIDKVNRHWARLVLGWVTVCWRVNHLGM